MISFDAHFLRFFVNTTFFSKDDIFIHYASITMKFVECVMHTFHYWCAKFLFRLLNSACFIKEKPGPVFFETVGTKIKQQGHYVHASQDSIILNI